MSAPTLPRLGAATLAQARPGTLLPAYDRRALETGIVHLGLGAFVRAHLATYNDDALALAPGPWGITGVCMTRPDARDRLLPQDGLYTALQRETGAVRARIVGCLRDALVVPEQPDSVVRAMSAPSCRIVSLTITEKGYCRDPATGGLDPRHADIVHDLAHPEQPRSAVGLIAAALRSRRDAGIGPFTVLCCDNLPHNGALLAALVRDFAALRHDGLAGWIEAHGAFPSTMVDRIAPALTAADERDAADVTGLSDAAPVAHEPFRQWVIEDRFAGLRPAWERVGAQIVNGVAPYEHMKLRLLNGAHSALAYLGYLAGFPTIADVVTEAPFRRFAESFWREVIAVTPAPAGVDLHRYTDDLLQRFGNAAIRHRTWQIAMDGSQKLPQRLLATASERLAGSRPIQAVALAIAGWIRYVRGDDELGRPIDVRDPMADRLQAALRGAGVDAARQAESVLTMAAVFGAALSGNHAFVHAVTDAYAQLCRLGARGAVAQLVTTEA